MSGPRGSLARRCNGVQGRFVPIRANQAYTLPLPQVAAASHKSDLHPPLANGCPPLYTIRTMDENVVHPFVNSSTLDAGSLQRPVAHTTDYRAPRKDIFSPLSTRVRHEHGLKGEKRRVDSIV